MADFAFSGDKELRDAAREAHDDPDNFDAWNKLLPLVSSQEGGLNRNSSPAAITAARQTFDEFLRRFPLFFGYWSRYADLEFSIAGPEAAEMVYERGVASVVSVDLWTKYCNFKVETCHEYDLIRELFERGIDAVGLDFHSHPLWDKFLEFEDRIEAHTNVFAILKRLISLPLHQYSRYFDRFRSMSTTRPLQELASVEKLDEATATVKEQTQREPTEQEIREKLDSDFYNIFQQNAQAVNSRWTYEAGIKRPYYLVVELEEDQLDNWRKYLDYEEEHGGFKNVAMLYERCLVPAAHYEEFWFRYVRWLLAQNKVEEGRMAYQRACSLFVPITSPGIRLHYAFLEESLGNSDTALAIHEAILDKFPNSVEVIVSLVNTTRRHKGVDQAIETLKSHVERTDCPNITRGALAAEWARLLLQFKSAVDDARQVFQSQRGTFINAADANLFWSKWLDFELRQASSAVNDTKSAQNARSVVDDIVQHSHLPLKSIEGLVSKYLEFLQERGDSESMREFLQLDKEVNGTYSISNLRKSKSVADATASVINGGHPQAQVPTPATSIQPTGVVGSGAFTAPFEKGTAQFAQIGPIPANGGQVSHTQTSLRWQK